MKNLEERKPYDINDVRDSSVEGINQDERLELKETNKMIETQRINNITNDRLFNEVYLGGDGICSDSPIDF